MSESFDFGREAENFAVDYFTALGYEIVAKNFFYNKAEIDLILKNENEIIMVEVKARKSININKPEDAVNQKKKKLLIKAANEFILRNKLNADVRFDILALVKQNDCWDINHIKDAFNALEL